MLGNDGCFNPHDLRGNARYYRRVMTWRTSENCRSLLEYSHDPHETQTGTFTEDFPNLGLVDLRDEAERLDSGNGTDFIVVAGIARDAQRAEDLALLVFYKYAAR